MTGTVTKLNRPMRKDELVRHLETDHSQTESRAIIAHRWTKVELVDLHRLIHLGLGR